MPGFPELFRGLLAIFAMCTSLVAAMVGIVALVVSVGLPIPVAVVAGVLTMAAGLALILTVVSTKMP